MGRGPVWAETMLQGQWESLGLSLLGAPAIPSHVHPLALPQGMVKPRPGVRFRTLTWSLSYICSHLCR